MGSQLQGIMCNANGLTKEETTYLIGIKMQCDTLREMLTDAKNLSFFSLAGSERVAEKLGKLKIKLSLFSHLDSAKTHGLVDTVNAALDAVIASATNLQAEIGKQKSNVATTIRKYKGEINEFLHFAGYKYEVDVDSETNSYKMKLKHLDFDAYLQEGSLHLSYGERNAFALVLFMYDCLAKKPDLIVLDDPISSFDKTKKFAILEMLFRGTNCLKNNTVVMLTHDIEPIIDLVKTLSNNFQPPPVAAFLHLKSGVLAELPIQKADVLSFHQICTANLSCSSHDVIKLIYLRRKCEILDDKGDAYQLLANLLHKAPVPRLLSPDREMTASEIAAATSAVKQDLASFDYAAVLLILNNDTAMRAAYAGAQNNYEKLQVFRVMYPSNHSNMVIRKYINETFHIENELIMQLNPRQYDFIPEYVIAECDTVLAAS